MLKNQSTIGAHNAGMLAASILHHSFSGRDFQRPGGSEFKLGRDYAMDEIEVLLPKIGVCFKSGVMEQMIDHAMDSIQQPQTTPSITTPIQFLQNWLPGVIEIVTAKQSIDEIVGRSTVGAWEDAQIVQQVVENTGSPVPYTDAGNVPLANWNPNFVLRTLVRFELGLRVGNLEELQSARMRIDSAGQKRKSDAIQLEIQRNAVGFYGVNDGAGFTYGLLNDPNLPAYITVATGAASASKLWSLKTFLEIQADLLTAFQTLRTQSQGRVTPNKDPITLTVPTNSIDYLAKSSNFGITVWDWLKQFYPNVRVVDAVQLNGANGGANVFYVHADSVMDSGSDDQRTFIQIVPATFQLLGIQKLAKGYEEDYSNATAGVLLKRPYAVVRFTGI